MSNLSETFNKRKALIIYVTAGDPSLLVTEKLVYDFEKAGADIIELGIPFSDPLADGPIIQASHLRGLKSKTDLKNVFALVRNIRKKTTIPLAFMLAYNLVEQYGYEKFYFDCEKYGVDATIIPDLPPEEKCVTRNTQCDDILFIAPTTPENRIKMIAGIASGFIYLVSTLGVTGKRTKLTAGVSELVGRIKKYTKLPVAVGFGISNAQQAGEVSRYADGVIVGSAIVDLVAKKKYKEAVKLVSQMRKQLDKE